jgi:hypothetical protein
MFVGAVPMTVVNQLLGAVDCTTWPEIFVCCSGSFRVDRALKAKYPDKIVRSNDVSLVSCAAGALLTGSTIDMTFKGRLAFMEEVGLADFEDRLAAVIVALGLSQFAGDNDFARGHFEHCRTHFPTYLAKAREKVLALRSGVLLDDFFAGDFRDHAQRAMVKGAGICGFMPTYKGGYERMYRFLDTNIDWQPPSFRTWDPKDMPEWLAEVHRAGVPYFIYSDQELRGFKPTTEFRSTTNKPVYGYMNEGRSSFRRSVNRSESFAYEKVDPATLGPNTDVQLVPATSAQMTFLRNAYLAKGIAHSTGVANYLVMLDGKLAGGFIYARAKYAPGEYIYLLSDFCIVHERRLAKLVAMLAASHETVDAWCKRTVTRPTRLCTTAFTDKPVSMKYRGIYELTGRKEGFLNYECEIGNRERTAKAIYLEWLGRFGQAGDAHRAAPAARAAAPRQERALHGRAGIQSAGGQPAP